MRISQLVAISAALALTAPAWAALPPAPGPYIAPGWNDFSGSGVDEQDWQVGTFYFFWYNTKNGMHIVDSDGTDACTTHYYKWIPGTTSYAQPPILAWDEPAWVEEQLEDMLAAGIDFLMPVYWGVPGTKDWNTEGVTTLAQVLLDRESKGKPSPRVGLFYDTSTLDKVDLSSQSGKEKFYGTIRDFYSMVPPRFWNRRDGKVLAWLYHSAFPSKKDDAAFTYARNQFAADFGGTPLSFVADQGWKDAGCSVDRVYSWGGALADGPKLFDYCEVGPGFDNTAVPWGSASLTQPRNGGAFYSSGWQKAVAHPCRVTAVETWNEWHESTDIAHSFEYGTQYIQLTASWAIKFRFKGSYLNAAYRYVMGRLPDKSGKQSYGDMLAGNPPSAVRDDILESPEAKDVLSNDGYIAFLYKHYLHRDPDAGGVKNYQDFLNGGGTRAQARDEFINSPEAMSKVSDNQFVTELYWQILFRKPDDEGFATYMGMLAQGTLRSTVRDNFLNSGEFTEKQVGQKGLADLAGVFDFAGWPKQGTWCTPYYKDADGDGAGGSDTGKCLYEPLAPFTKTTGGDCNDANPQVKPGAQEVCNAADDNCNGQADEGLFNACGTCGPAPDEVCDGQDNDCDGKVDEGLLNACGTCGPAPDEVCDGQDNDCDGQVDEGCPACPNGQIQACIPPGGDCANGLQLCTDGSWGECVSTCPPPDVVEEEDWMPQDVEAPDGAGQPDLVADLPGPAPDSGPGPEIPALDSAAGEVLPADGMAGKSELENQDGTAEIGGAGDGWFTVPADGHSGDGGSGKKSGGCSAAPGPSEGASVWILLLLGGAMLGVIRRFRAPVAGGSGIGGPGSGSRARCGRGAQAGTGCGHWRGGFGLLLAALFLAACGSVSGGSSADADVLLFPGADVPSHVPDGSGDRQPEPEAMVPDDSYEPKDQVNTSFDSAAADAPGDIKLLDAPEPDAGPDGSPKDETPGPTDTLITDTLPADVEDSQSPDAAADLAADTCTPLCEGKQCGDDGCGGFCGACPPGLDCEGGTCKQAPCVPQCGGKQCGDDGCAGSCGACPPDYVCQEGACIFAAGCIDVPKPEPVSEDPLGALSPAGPAETVKEGGFTDDYVHDPTSYIKVGTRREWGSTIVFFGLAKGKPGMNTTNTIDANDTGREVQIALYDPLRAMQGCAWNATCQSNPGAACPSSITYLGWDPVQGGNECNIGSGTEWINVAPGILEAGVRPLFWNPDWKEPTCANGGCSDPGKKAMKSDVSYTQRLRFVATHVVEMKMTVENLSDLDHPATGQEFPTLYAVYGAGGTADLKVLLDSNGQQIIVDGPGNDGFYFKNFTSPGGWVALQNASKDYGVGIYYENRLTGFQGWQKLGVFNNVRSQFSFALPAFGKVKARAYLILGAFGTIASEAAALDAKLPPFGALDAPKMDAAVSGTLHVTGWALDNKGIASLALRRDGVQVASLPLNTQRPDVCQVYPGYTMCNQVGFEADVPLGDWSPCPHLLEIAASDTDGNVRVVARVRVFANGAPGCGKDADCDDGDPCTMDTCAGAAGCQHEKLPCLPGTHPIYRFYGNKGGDSDHMFKSDTTAPAGYAFEGQHFTLFDGPAPGLVALHQLYCSGCFDHLQSLDGNEGAPAYQDEGVLGYCAANPIPEASKELRRLYSVAASDHFVSTSQQEWSEAQALGYVPEGTLCYVP